MLGHGMNITPLLLHNFSPPVLSSSSSSLSSALELYFLFLQNTCRDVQPRSLVPPACAPSVRGMYNLHHLLDRYWTAAPSVECIWTVLHLSSIHSSICYIHVLLIYKSHFPTPTSLVSPTPLPPLFIPSHGIAVTIKPPFISPSVSPRSASSLAGAGW